MTKKAFLKELEKRLKVLNDQEIKDIIDEYSDIVDEKVKHGKTEEEAINDFGSIDELVEEILKAYKINPNYDEKKEDKFQEFASKSEDVIKDTANKLADFTKKVVNNISNGDSLSIEMIFEIIIKAFLFLLACLILRIPFMFLNELGKAVLEMFFFPMNRILTFTWILLTSMLYFISCVLLAIRIFQGYFKKGSNKKVNEKPAKKEKKEEVKKESVSEEKKETKVREQRSDDGIIKAFAIIGKIFIIFVFLLPLAFATMGLFIAITFIIYLLFKGLPLAGPLLILVGLVIIFCYFTYLFTQIVTSKPIKNFFTIFVSIPLMFIGGLVTFDRFTAITYYDTLPESNYREDLKVYTETVDSPARVINNTNGDITLITDNDLEDNQVRIEVKYYSGITSTTVTKYNNNDITVSNNFNSVQIKRVIDLVVDDLKNNAVYNYAKYGDVSINVYANSNTRVNIN